MYSHIQMVIKVLNVILRYIVPSILHPLLQFGMKSISLCSSIMCMCLVLLKKTYDLPVEEMVVAGGYQPVQCSGLCLLYPSEIPNQTASCNWWPPCHEAWGGASISWVNALRKMTLNRSMLTRVRPTFAYRQNLLSLMKTTECHSTLQSTLLWHLYSTAEEGHCVIWPKYSFSFRFISICLSNAYPRAGRRSRQS